MRHDVVLTGTDYQRVGPRGGRAGNGGVAGVIIGQRTADGYGAVSVGGAAAASDEESPSTGNLARNTAGAANGGIAGKDERYAGVGAARRAAQNPIGAAQS